MKPSDNNSTEPVSDALRGLFFRTFDADGLHEFQGQILGRPEAGYYLCQLFNQISGEPSCAKLAHVSGMDGWAFYATHEEWLHAATHKKCHAGSVARVKAIKTKNDVFSESPRNGQ